MVALYGMVVVSLCLAVYDLIIDNIIGNLMKNHIQCLENYYIFVKLLFAETNVAIFVYAISVVSLT